MNENLNYSFKILQESRKKLSDIFTGLSRDQLTEIPTGFSNNIIWNIAHVICTQHLLAYRLFGNKLNLSDEFVERYRKGSKPGEKYFQEDERTVNRELEHGMVELQSQIEVLRRQGQIKYETSFGVTLKSIDDVVKFLVMHEGIHLGYIMAMKKSIQ